MLTMSASPAFMGVMSRPALMMVMRSPALGGVVRSPVAMVERPAAPVVMVIRYGRYRCKDRQTDRPAGRNSSCRGGRNSQEMPAGQTGQPNPI